MPNLFLDYKDDYFVNEKKKNYILRRDRKYFKNSNQFKFLRSFNLNREELILNLKKIDNIYNLILEILVDDLNKYHNLKLKKQSWEIICGKWLYYFLSNLKFNLNFYEKIIREKKLRNFYINEFDENYFRVYDTNDFLSLTIKKDWNNYVLSNILTHVGVKKKNFVKKKIK